MFTQLYKTTVDVLVFGCRTGVEVGFDESINSIIGSHTFIVCHFSVWYVGISWMLRGIKRQQNLTDRSLLWLKDLYIQLYFENKGQPLVADAIKVNHN